MIVDAIERRITGVSFRNPQGVGPNMSVLVLRLPNGEMEVPNTGWTMDNPALKVMAYLDVSPSTVEDAVGETILVRYDSVEGTIVPAPSRYVMKIGEKKLKQADWMATPSDAVKIPLEEA